MQELEQSIGDLKKRMLEQQRAIKMNEKNEAQVKKLAEEIRGIKAQKVNSLINLFIIISLTNSPLINLRFG